MDLPESLASRSFPRRWGKKCQNSEGQETIGILIIRLSGLKLYHVLGLRSLGTLGYIKFHRLFFRQGVKAFALDGAVMHEHIRTAFPSDKAKTLGVVKPFYRTSFLHDETSSSMLQRYTSQKSRAHSSQAKKIGLGDLATRPTIVQNLWPGFQSDILNLFYFTRKLINVKLIKITLYLLTK
jgi:hypothetical protein